jgi:soluble lytic murein transglycosylase
LLDDKKPDLAYALAANHSAQGREQFIEAEFHAGWIALRFLNDATKAMPHFARAAQRAETPISRARAAYWQGRAAQAQNKLDEARQFYTRAAQEPTVYYGQIAREKLGLPATGLRRAKPAALGDARLPAVRVAEFLYAMGETEQATNLASDAGRAISDEAQLAALALIASRNKDARASLAIGKQALQRGLPLDEAAFPLSGIPHFEPASLSAPLPVVHAIARQESAFHPRALSSAGAKGLMQMIDATAQRTAKQIGVPFEKSKLLDEPAYNAQLGAAHLGQLLADFKGSHILAFVAYNAGPRRARDWIAAYGDPRDPAIDPIDWVERIPFSETRNYVQRVMENLDVYARLIEKADSTTLRAELRTDDRRL